MSAWAPADFLSPLSTSGAGLGCQHRHTATPPPATRHPPPMPPPRFLPVCQGRASASAGCHPRHHHHIPDLIPPAHLSRHERARTGAYFQTSLGRQESTSPLFLLMHGPEDAAFEIPCANAFIIDRLHLALDPIVSSLMRLAPPEHAQHGERGHVCKPQPVQPQADLTEQAAPPARGAIACVNTPPQPSLLSHYGDVDLDLIGERWAKGCASLEFSSWWLGGGGGDMFQEGGGGTPLQLMPSLVGDDTVKCVCFCSTCDESSEWSSRHCLPEKLAARLVNAVACKIGNSTFLDVHVSQSRQQHGRPMSTATAGSLSLQGGSNPDRDSSHHGDPGPAAVRAGVDRGDPMSDARLPTAAEPNVGHRQNKRPPPSVLIIDVDSVSRAHAVRFLPKTLLALRQLHPFHTHTEFTQFATVASNSIPNQMALLSGCFRNAA